MTFHCPSLPFHCLSSTLHCLSLTLHCIFTAVPCLLTAFRYDDEWAPLQQEFTATVRTPGQHLPEGMVRQQHPAVPPAAAVAQPLPHSRDRSDLVGRGRAFMHRSTVRWPAESMGGGCRPCCLSASSFAAFHCLSLPFQVDVPAIDGYLFVSSNNCIEGASPVHTAARCARMQQLPLPPTTAP